MFTIHIPQKHHDALRGFLTDAEHVTIFDGNSGRITEPNTGATVDFALDGETATFAVVDGKYESEAEIKARLERDLASLLG